MGLHLINKNSPPSSPKRIRGTLKSGQEYSLEWKSQFTPFNSFVSQVQKFQRDNELTEMTADEIEDRICQQLGKTHCSGDPVGYRPAPQRRPGCKSCGKW
jgi:hypothetical protein